MLISSGHRNVGYVAASCALLFLAVGCAPDITSAKDTDHSHDSSGSHAHDTPDPVAVTVFTDKVELFMEYPRLVPGLEARYLAHVTVLATGQPVRSGRLRLELTRGSDATIVLKAPKPTRDGLFIPVSALEAPGEYEAKIIITSDQVEDTIPLAPVIVHANIHDAHHAAKADAIGEPKDAVPFLLEQAWKIGLLLEQVEHRTLTERLQVLGEVEAPHYATAVVGAPIQGRLLPPDIGHIPHIGESVEQGQILAYIEPPLNNSDRAQLAANSTSYYTIEVALLESEYDLQAEAIVVEQRLLQSQTRLVFARQALARIEQLRTKDLGTVASLEAARRDVKLAEHESKSADSLRKSLMTSQEQLAALRQRAMTARAENAGTERLRLPLIAPISGEVVGVEFVEGEHVTSQAAVYHLIDMTSAWIATHISEFDLARIGDAPGALMSLAAFPDRTFDLLGELNGQIVSFGRVVDPETRTIPLRYDVTNPEGMLRAGMFADVFLETKSAFNAVALPQEAIVMDNGQPIAFVLINGELYQKRVLDLGVRDGRFVEVRSGLQAGERVVMKGAYLVKLASASPASFGHGHAH
ncbi:MAG: cobalt-zinc-cadmium efflux system membrane fusion protein [Planctomycetota bacterium]|jgi:cobalt-zinc-cadmium efflux system membrane fusion protein